MRVLCVEDNGVLGDLQRIFLEYAGYEAMVARDGQSAWELLKTHGADLLIADQDMLQEAGGRLLGRVRDAGMTLRVLLVFGSLEALALEEWERPGIAGMLLKPYTQSGLLAAVKQALAATPICASAVLMEHVQARRFA